MGRFVLMLVLAVTWPGTVWSATQWVGVQYGENSTIPGSSLDAVDRADDTYCQAPTTMMNAKGAFAGANGYEGDNYDVSVMTAFYPGTPFYSYPASFEGGYHHAADILQYASSEKHLSWGACLNTAGQMGGWALKGGMQVAAMWDGTTLRQVKTSGGAYVTAESSVRCINKNGYGVAAIRGTDINSTSGYSDYVYVIDSTGQVVYQLISEDFNDSSSTKGGGAFAMNASRYVAGYCWRHDPSADYNDGETVIRTNRPSAVVWDDKGKRTFDLYRDKGILYSAVFDINDAGHFVGRYKNYRCAFLVRSGKTLIDIPSLLGSDKAAMAAMSINASDHVCGWSVTGADLVPHAFYWQEGSAPVDLGSMGQDHAWGLEIDDNDNIYGCTSESIFTPDYLVRWSHEQAIDANGDGTADTAQENVVNYTSAMGTPVVLANAASGALSDVQSWIEFSNVLETYGSSYEEIFSFYIWDVPLGYVHFHVPADAKGKAHVQWKATQKLPVKYAKVVANSTAHTQETGKMIYAREVASAAAADKLGTTTLMATGSLDSNGRLTVDLYLSDGGPADCDGKVNGTIEFFGGALGISSFSAMDYILGKNMAAPEYAAFGVTFDAEKLGLLDSNKDGKVNVADVVTDAKSNGTALVSPPTQPANVDWNASKWGLH